MELEEINNKQFLEEVRDRVVEKILEGIKPPEFDGGRVPLTIAAAIMRKNPMFVRRGIESGKIPIGCIMSGEGKKKDIYISPKLFYEYTGYIYKTDNESEMG